MKKYPESQKTSENSTQTFEEFFIERKIFFFSGSNLLIETHPCFREKVRNIFLRSS